MFLAVGSITQMALKIIASTGGSIDFACGAQIIVVKLSEGAAIRWSGGTHEIQDAYIAFSQEAKPVLHLRRGWDIKDCRLALNGEDMSGLTNNWIEKQEDL